MVESRLMVRWVVGYIPHGGPTELFLKGRGMIYPVFVFDAYKRYLAANRKE